MKDPDSLSPLAMLMEAMEKEPSREPEGTTTGIGPDDTQSGDWLVVMYKQNWWLAKALTIDPEHQDVQVEIFHPHGPNVCFRKKQGWRDVCSVPFTDILDKLNEPSSPVHTSSTREMYNISAEVMDFIEEEHLNRLLPGV